MKQLDIEKKLNNAGHKRMPELAMDELISKANTITPDKKQSLHHTKKMVLAISMCLILVLAISLISTQTYYASAESYIYIDINPSIKIVVQRDGKVKAVEALNSDAENIISNMDFNKKTVEECTDMLLNKLYSEGFIDEDAEIYISCAGKNNERATNAMNKTQNSTQKFLNGKNSNAKICMTNGISKNGSSKISPAKQNVITQILQTENNEYSETELQQMSMNELNQLLDNNNNGNNNDNSNGNGNHGKNNG